MSSFGVSDQNLRLSILESRHTTRVPISKVSKARVAMRNTLAILSQLNGVIIPGGRREGEDTMEWEA